MAAFWQLQASWRHPLAEPDTNIEDEELDLYDSVARGKLNNLFSIVPARISRKPNMDYIYYKQEETVIASVPPDLQLEWFFRNCSAVSISAALHSMPD